MSAWSLGNHRECWHLQCYIWTTPVNSCHFLSRSAFLPKAEVHSLASLTSALGKGHKGRGTWSQIWHSSFMCIGEKGHFSMCCSFHTLFVYPFFCLVSWLKQGQIFSWSGFIALSDSDKATKMSVSLGSWLPPPSAFPQDTQYKGKCHWETWPLLRWFLFNCSLTWGL